MLYIVQGRLPSSRPALAKCLPRLRYKNGVVSAPIEFWFGFAGRVDICKKTASVFKAACDMVGD
eukprot:4820527-Amphidinium_carterae.1